MNRFKSALLLCVSLATPIISGAAVAQSSDIRILKTDPLCSAERLGRVRIELGEKKPDPRRGGSLPTIGYARAFERLGSAGGERGANVVVLREHEADYFARGARRPSRPTYVALEGLAMRLSAPAACSVVEIDPAEFEREASKKSRTNVTNSAGVSF